MSGLEKIVAQIRAEAESESKKITDEAKAEAEQIIAETKEQTGKSVAEIRKRADAQEVILEQRAHSANDLYLRTQTLTVKQDVIADVIDMAYEKVCKKNGEEYFGMLIKLIEKNALPQDGEIYFSKADLKAMPGGYEDKISDAARRAGGTLKLSREGCEIENGFVLDYGGIEENCTIKAIFDAKRDEMQDTVNAILYGKEAVDG